MDNRPAFHVCSRSLRAVLRHPLKLGISLLLAITSTACVYHMPIRQGNILVQDKVEQLKVGMTKSQVEYLLGSPMANDPFVPRQWTYLYYYKSPGNDVDERVLHLYFRDQKLARIEGPKQLRGKYQKLHSVAEQSESGGRANERRQGPSMPSTIPNNPNRGPGTPP